MTSATHLAARVEQWRRLTHALGHDTPRPRSAYADALDVDALADTVLAALALEARPPDGVECTPVSTSAG